MYKKNVKVATQRTVQIRRLTICFAVLVFLLYPTMGSAAIIEYSFTGEVITSTDPAIAVGESYSGLFRYDSQASLAQIGANFKQYSDPSLQVEFTFAGPELTFAGGNMSVTDFPPNSHFGFYANGSVSTNGTTADYFIVNLGFNALGMTFGPGFAIPTDLTMMTPQTGLLRDTSYNYLLTYTVEQLTLVPEPASLSILAFAGLLFARRR